MKALGKAAAVLGLAITLSACGHNTEQKAATGAATGAVIAGPVGAVIGAGVGVVTQKAEDNKK
jgi:zinc transporter ZupT